LRVHNTMKANWSLNLLCLMAFCCCATTGGKDQGHALLNWWPSAGQWGDAAGGAIKHPGTWSPAIGAILIAVGNWDGDISDWATKEKPIFGSYQTAQDASDILCTSAHMGMVTTAWLVPAEDRPWLASTAWRIAWEHLGVMVASYATDPIKKWTARDRPNGGPRSFPSWHATRAAAYAGMGYRNLNLIDMRPVYRHSAQLALATLAAGTAWARVEAGQHYPTDVLAGAALGNFIAILIHDAFLNRNLRSEISLRTNLDGSVILEFETGF
jgi:hypothetical protein